MTLKRCKYCATEIQAEALLCPICKNYQAKWRNQLTYFAGIAAFLALLASALTFVAQASEQFYKNLFWKDVLDLRYYNTGLRPDYSIVLSNSGYGPLFILNVSTYWRRGNAEYRLDKLLPANEFLSRERKLLPGSEYDAYVANTTGVAPTAVIGSAGVTEESEGIDQRECFLAQFSNEGSPTNERMNTFFAADGKKLATDSADTYVTYFNTRTNTTVKSKFPTVVTFLRLNTPRCMQIPFE